MGLLQEILVIGVADHTPSTVVELNVAAADGVQLLDNGAVGGGNILQQLLMVGINGIGIFAVLLAVQFCQQLSWSRHGLAGDAVLILKLFNELVVLHKGMILAADLAAHLDRAVGSFLSMEEVTVIQFHFLNAVEPPHEIQMPVAAAELTIGDGVVTGALLLLDQAGDLFIFHSGQGGTVNFAGLELCACFFQVLGAQKAAHKIITER